MGGMKRRPALTSGLPQFTMPSFGWDATTMTPCFKVKGLAATMPSFQDEAATLPMFVWDAITRTPCFKGLAGMMPSLEDQATTTSSFQDEATMMPSFGWDGITSMMPLFEDVAATMPLFEDQATMMPSFQDEAATMPSSEDGSATTTSFDCDAHYNDVYYQGVQMTQSPHEQDKESH